MATISNSSSTPEQPQFTSNNVSQNETNNEFSTFEDFDTAALLQSLADFEHPVSFNEPSTPKVNDSRQVANKEGRRPSQSVGRKQPDQIVFIASRIGSLKNTKRKRKVASEDDEVEAGFVLMSKAKKKKLRVQDDEESLAKGRQIWGPGYGRHNNEDGDESHNENLTPKRRLTVAEKRAAGVQSAAALFRKPSAASLKYTRQPMATVYLQMEVSPPRFLELQAASKSFMLDPEHPDRIDCVGNRSKGDTDLTKLKLFGCVTEFLEDLGWGEKCWGAAEPTPPNADGTRPEKHRRLQWPEFKQEIVTMLTPLFRRTITNERQRLYALEARTKKKGSKVASNGHESSNENSPNPSQEGTPPSTANRMSAPSPSPNPTIDPQLNQDHPLINDTRALDKELVSKTQSSDVSSTNSGFRETDGIDLKYFINIMRNEHRIKPKIILSPASCADYRSLVSHIKATIDDENLAFSVIKVLGPGTWLKVGSDGEWKAAIGVVRNTEYLDGEVKCIVEIGDA